MAKDLKIKITTDANVAGAKQAEAALEAVEAAAKDAEAAADKAGASPATASPAPPAPGKLAPAREEITQVDEAAKQAADSVTDFAAGMELAGDASAKAAGQFRQSGEALEEISTHQRQASKASADAAAEERKQADALRQMEEAAEAAAAASRKIEPPRVNDEPVKKTTRSIRDLEEELARLKGELREIEIGSPAFEATSTQIGEVERKLADANAAAKGFARAAGDGQGPTRNFGGAVLELSRAVEDAQYGLRGVQNNIPGLITMLGGSAGLAGVISLVVVAAGLLGPKLLSLGDDADKPKDRINGLREILKSLDADLGKIRATEADMAGGGVKAFEDRKAAIDRDIAAVNGYIEALKSAIKHEGEMQKFRFQSELDSVDSKQRKGELTPDEAEQQRTAIKTRMQQDELERLKLLDDADATAFRAKLELLKKQEENAKKEAEAATQALQGREEQLKQLKREVLVRQQLETQIQTLAEQAKKIPNADKLPFLQEAEIDRLRKLAAQPIVDQGPANQDRNNSIEAARATLAHLERFNELLEQRAELEREIAAKAPRPIQDVKVKDENGEDRTIPSAAKREKDRLEEGVKGELPSLAELNENVKTFGEAAKSAAERVKEAEQALAQKESSNVQQDTQRREVAVADNPVLHDVEQTAATQVGELLQRVLAQIPNAADDSVVKALVEQLNALRDNGLQQGEMDAAQGIITSIQAKIAADNVERQRLGQEIRKVFDDNNTLLRSIAGLFKQQEGINREVAREIRDIKLRP